MEQDGLFRRRARTVGVPAGHGKLLGDQDGANIASAANDHRREGHAAARGDPAPVPADALRRFDPGVLCVFHLRHRRLTAVHVEDVAAVRHFGQPREWVHIMRLTGHRGVHGMRRQLCATRGTRVGVSGGRGRRRAVLRPQFGLLSEPRGRRRRELVSARPVLRHPAKAGFAKLWVQQLRQHCVGVADDLPVHQHGGLDQHHVHGHGHGDDVDVAVLRRPHRLRIVFRRELGARGAVRVLHRRRDGWGGSG
mmetsp:Transcript_2800/g.10384  ORF Transcript_2800/g.10384 Transcript_2800/m.10384 type:complete len:251 (-) Transcript_2800:5236-5988(-)